MPRDSCAARSDAASSCGSRPELAFELDRGAEYLQDMTALLDKLHKEPSDS